MTIPAPLTADDFWASIEDAWATIPGTADARAALASPSTEGEARFEAAERLEPHLRLFLAALKTALEGYTQPQLAAWDGHIAQALYDIDREDVHAATDGSDDGFLYARGFIVALGKQYYDKVNAEPATYGVEDAEFENICYEASHVHDARFGEWPPHAVSRESGSNKAGWPSIQRE
ncbi:uncharacterized protein LOC62_04G006558 [Vanrija pseudolonga]|uniref:DUF4240 domain-containing protein n=1 Tax=Vanrija pseudolonga TaxID=143232 RepID=A0AAF0YAI1_9TREE|nr:hypothetical protein LOC62_04G006558 [Vanrija pseudolonga]